MPQPLRQEASQVIAQRVLGMNCLAMASSVGVYAGVGSEVQTLPMIQALVRAGRVVGLPSMQGGVMAMREVADVAAMVTGDFGVPEPPEDAQVIEPDVLLIPGVGFTETGHRIGQGAGHYDRYLEGRYPKPVAIGLAFDEQVVDELPFEAHDQRMNFVVTQTRLIDCLED